MKATELGQVLDKESFTTGALRQDDLGYVATVSDKLVEEGVPHTMLNQIYKGDLFGDEIPWSVCSVSICWIPIEQSISISPEGYVEVVGGGEKREEKRISSSVGKRFGPENRGDLREVRGIAGGRAYAVGTARQAYVRVDRDTWERIDQTAQSEKANMTEKSFESIDGFTETDIYAVGWDGEIFHYDGKQWQQKKSPTKLALSKVRCALDGYVYACGQSGVVVRGKEDDWEIIGKGVTDEDLWGLEFFEGKLYVASMYQLYQFDGKELTPIKFGRCEPPSTCYHLSASKGVMWSIGAKDLLEFNGKTWKSVIG
jgi:hypothetical protein